LYDRDLPVPLATKRLSFREMTLADLDAMTSLLGSPEVMWVNPLPFSRSDVRRWVEDNLRRYRDRGFGMWLLSLKDTGAFVGECGLVPQYVEDTTEIEVAYRILPAFQGRGLATEAASACRDVARDFLELDRIVAMIDPRNVASQRVATKVGLTYERDVTVGGKRLLLYSIAL
jgi:RimJ/RimL family protein N-acetyltransferase